MMNDDFKKLLLSDEKSFFAEAMADVVPQKTKQDRAPHYKKPLDTNPNARLRDELLALKESQSSHAGLGALVQDDELVYHQPSVQKHVLRKLKRGEFAVQGELDLHRHTVKAAGHALRDFLVLARQQGISCVRIVPGKGLHSQKQPVLRGWLVNTLRQRDDVLAFAPAKYNDGGYGALYVLLSY